MSVRCPVCRAEVEGGASYCDLCGAELTSPSIGAMPPAGNPESTMTTRCSQCGADNRNTASFCCVCGADLKRPLLMRKARSAGPLPVAGMAGVPAGSRALSPRQVGVPAPLLGPASLVVTLREWEPPPQVEGRVVFTGDPTSEPKGDVMLRALLAVILGLIHSMLAWLPWIRKSEVAVRDIRIRDDHTDRVVNVRMRGNPTSSIDLGDVVAVWGKWDGGTLVMNVAYNYTTQSDVKLKHK